MSSLMIEAKSSSVCLDNISNNNHTTGTAVIADTLCGFRSINLPIRSTLQVSVIGRRNSDINLE